MEWKAATKIEGAEGHYIPERWLYMHYYEALNILFRAENSLRVFVYLVLKNKFGTAWDNCSLQVNESENSTIRNTAQKRINQAKGFGYLGYEVTSALMFLNSGELTKLIFSDTYWEHFRPYFKGRKEIFQNKLEEVASIRNSLAHFRPISKDDIEVVKQNLRHCFIGIEECLNQMFKVNVAVPTNTTDDWYLRLNSLGDEFVSLKLEYDQTKEWCKISIYFTCPVVSSRNIGDDYSIYKLLKLNSDAVVTECKSISEYCIFCDDQTPHTAKPNSETPNFRNCARITFRAKTLHDNFELIAKDIEFILEKIKHAVEMLKNDNLAQGKFLSIVTATARYETRSDRPSWRVLNSNLDNPSKPTDPSEYWGNFQSSMGDFVAGTRHYPWMPVNISEYENPFDF